MAWGLPSAIVGSFACCGSRTVDGKNDWSDCAIWETDTKKIKNSVHLGYKIPSTSLRNSSRSSRT